MRAGQEQEERFLISLADLKRMLIKGKKVILSCAIAVAFLGIFYALLKPVRYEAEGTFREKGIKTNHVSSSSVMQFLSGAVLSGTESEAASLMSSRRILKEVVEKLHLQGSLQSANESDTPFRRIKNNVSLAWASAFSRSPLPVLDDPSPSLEINSLSYHGEVPLSFLLKIKEGNRYELSGQGYTVFPPAEGTFGTPFTFGDLSFTVSPSQANTSGLSAHYHFTIDPLQQTVKSLYKQLDIAPSKLDKSLLKMKCVHSDRRMAGKIVNAVMESYQDYLKGYHGEVAMNQLEYLNFRRDQLTRNLGRLMQQHADSLTDDLSNSGFMDSAKEMDFLAKSQHEYKQKLLDNELEIKRLKSIHPSNLAYYDRFSSNEGDPVVINSILSEMRSLKQQRDALEVELQNKSADQSGNLQRNFSKQLQELKEVQRNRMELKEATELFQHDQFPENSNLAGDPRFLLTEWFERLQTAKAEKDVHADKIQENFQDYLKNLERSFAVHERILQERLTHQQNPSSEFQGISLEVATNLYLDYSKQLVQIEGAIRQNLFFIRQIEEPDFEITSLSSGLDDEISRDMIRKAGELVLNLRDQNNQSGREQERIKEELGLQRTFLKMHLKQKVRLMELNKELINEKIFALENISLELIHQSILLLEKNLQDYLQSRLDNLQQERVLIQRHLENIRSDMALLPQKWVSEKLLAEEVETNQKIVEEIAKLVESKNISHNLDIIQSAPVDAALSPLHPVTPNIFLWGFLGFFLGGFAGSGYVLGRQLNKGLPATEENLARLGFHVSGKLQDIHFNMDVLRRLQGYMEESSKGETQLGKLLLLLEGRGPHYTPELAALFLMRGKRVLTLDFDFQNPGKIASPGLLQYLLGSINHLPIRKGMHGDRLEAGGAMFHFVEILHAPAFQKLLAELKNEYDWIIAFCPSPPSGAEAQALLDLFPRVAVTVCSETMDELMPYLQWQEEKDSKLSLLLFEEPKIEGNTSKDYLSFILKYLKSKIGDLRVWGFVKRL